MFPSDLLWKQKSKKSQSEQNTASVSTLHPSPSQSEFNAAAAVISAGQRGSAIEMSCQTHQLPRGNSAAPPRLQTKTRHPQTRPHATRCSSPPARSALLSTVQGGVERLQTPQPRWRQRTRRTNGRTPRRITEVLLSNVFLKTKVP